MRARTSRFFSEFFQMEAAGGILLFISAVVAVIVANSPLQSLYHDFRELPFSIALGSFALDKPLVLWINDGLMAVFFFLVGLELKRELIEGELSSVKNIILPGAGAVGGMVVPALIYAWLNWDDPIAIRGWAIPAATDIAFALGVMSLLGSRVPISLKVFLTSLAIFDDIGAIVIIALFYTEKISMAALAVVLGCLIVLTVFNRRNVVEKSPYVLVGLVMWVATLKSGVHATLAGVALAMFIPMRSKANPDYSPLKNLEHDLHSVVAYFVLPVFAFANTGISVAGMSAEQLLHGVPLGVALGLFFGKQIGVVGCCALFIKLKWTDLPRGVNWASLYGAAALCGIGFTMSLFIGSLAFQGVSVDGAFDERVGIILGSLASGLVGYLVLNKSLGKASDKVEES